ncbi:MAG: hypothetical protein ABEI86_03200, partial [Halobacteriaceae archaeon]
MHTFVPGLPLTFLDYNLVTGDSLAGIGTLDEVTEILDVEQSSLGMFTGGQSVMNEIREDIDELGSFADASAEQVEEARETRAEIEEKLEQVRARFDILAASRIDDKIDTDPVSDTGIDITQKGCYEQAQDVLESTDPLHFPAAFPEVFDEDESGFDLIVGNPPWEEATLEEDEFWARHEPGLQREESHGGDKSKIIKNLKSQRPDLVAEFEEEKSQEEKRRRILRNGPYPGMGSGDPDLYKAFNWRFWHLVREDGFVGAVLPGSVFQAAGSEEIRRKLLNESIIQDLTLLTNNNGWVFENVHPQLTIGLLSYQQNPPDPDDTLPLRGPYTSVESYKSGVETSPYKFDIDNAKKWTGTASLPMLPSDPRSVDVFKQFAIHPRLDRDEPGEWRARPYAELHETNDKTTDDGTRLMYLDKDDPEGYWPVFDGASINPPRTDRWIMDTGERFAYADPDVIVDYLQESRENSYRYAGSRSAFSEFSEEWVYNRETLPCFSARVAFRDVTQRTNTRTVCASLVPPKVVLTNKAPYFLWPRGTAKDEAYLLGILNSIPLDWYARRFVEISLNYHILNGFPIPRPDNDSLLRQRVVEIAGRLASKDDRYREWASDVGVDYGPLDETEELKKIYELDAVVAHLYQLSSHDLKVIFETFHDGWDYEERLERVLDY